MEKKMNDKQMLEFFSPFTETNDYTVAFFHKIPKKCVEENEELLDKIAVIEPILGILYDDAPKLTDKQKEEIKNKWEKYKKGE